MTTNISPNLYATKNGAPPRVRLSVAVTAADTYNVSMKATGTISFPANPTSGTTIILDGTTWTFITALTSGNQLLLGASLPLTMAAAATTLNASTDTDTATMDYQAGGNELKLTAFAGGTAGNALTITAGTSGGTASGATLTGGLALVTGLVDHDGPFGKSCAALRALGPYDNSAWVEFLMPLVGGGVVLQSFPITHGIKASTQYYSGDSEA